MNVLRAGLLAAILGSGCAPPVCGDVTIKGVATNPDIEKFRNGDGSIGLFELCGIDYGAFSMNRADLKMTTLVLDANVRDTELADDLRVAGVILPAGSVAFWDAHLVPGTTITASQLAGSGLHKRSEGSTYATHAFTAGSVKVVEGPRNRQVENFGDMDWTEEWHLVWDLEFGSGTQQHWTGDDWVKRSSDSPIGTPAFTPPDPMP